MTDSLESRVKDGAVLLNVGTYRQKYPWSCGPSALKIVLDSFGRRVSEKKLIQLAGSHPKNGTPPENLCFAAKTLGYRTFQQTNASVADIEMFLNAGVPVIVVYQGFGKPEGYKEGHYTVIYGASRTHLYRSDPSTDAGYMRPLLKDKFLMRWHDKDAEKNKYEHWLMVVFPSKIPFIEAEGSNYDIGFAVGDACKNDIHAMLEHVKSDYEHKTKNDFTTLIEKSRRFAKICKSAHPEYVQELNGMADGAEIDFNELFVLSCTEELDWGSSDNRLLEKCTSLVAKINGRTVLGHNEDYSIYPCNALYILKAKPSSKPSFLSVGYMGSLAGSCAGFNDAGIGMAGNSIHSSDVRFGVLKNFICRRILDETSAENAVKHIVESRRAIGGNYSIISEDCSFFVETFARKSAVVALDSFPAGHTNHCVSRKLKGFESFVSKSSVLRYKRLQSVFENVEGCGFSMDTLKELLMDHSDYPVSICRHDYESLQKIKGGSSTLASIIINPKKRIMEFASGNPCRSNYEVYRL